MKVLNKYRWLLLVCAVLGGCIKDVNPPCDEVPDEDETLFTKGYSLDFVVTLDALGGDGLSLKYDDYVDTEKFRVFFFTDDEDRTIEADERNVFLFESRTRFIKMLPGTSGPGSTWRVSVPLFSYGNGAAAEWNWEKIRRFLRKHPFKIALLVNRPESEWSMRIIGKTTETYNDKGELSWADNPEDVIVPGAWYDNSAPHWEAENTLFGKANPNEVVTDDKLDPEFKRENKELWKTLLDLQHVQYDPIYFGKSFVVNPPDDRLTDNVTDPDDPKYNGGVGKYYHNAYPIYDFVGKKGDDGRLMMGSTSSWVSWSGYDGELATNPNITGKIWDFSSPEIKAKLTSSVMYGDRGTKKTNFSYSLRGGPEYTSDGTATYTVNLDNDVENGLVLYNNGNGSIFYKDNTNLDNNDNAAGTKGETNLSFYFVLPAGTWTVSADVAKVAVNNDSSNRTLHLGIEGRNDLTKTFSSTSHAVYSFTVTLDKPTRVKVYSMGRTSFYSISYAEAGASGTNRDPYGWNFRRTIHPSKDYPIPMYGIQRFEPIEEWDWGTPVLLDKDIYLLRSVVRLDLYVPENVDVEFLTLFYSNVFSRCEPMDVWTPTDVLWNRYVTGEDGLPQSFEMSQILNYGPITRQAENDAFPNKTTDEEGSIQRYRQRMSWLYGIWVEKAGWKWNNFVVNPKDPIHKGNVADDPKTSDLFFPHIFNPCVQRNTAVYCPVGAPPVTLAKTGKTVQDPAWNDYIGVNGVNTNTVEVRSDRNGYRRFAIYTGERNINDPSTFTDIGNNGSGKPTVAYFMIGIKGASYSIPLVNYGGGTGNSLGTYDGNPVVIADYGYDKKPENGKMGGSDGTFEHNVMKNPKAGASKLPYPLIRNHVYQFTISGATRAGESGIRVSSAVRHSNLHRMDKTTSDEKINVSSE